VVIGSPAGAIGAGVVNAPVTVVVAAAALPPISAWTSPSSVPSAFDAAASVPA
jgi:hypothetical protein